MPIVLKEMWDQFVELKFILLRKCFLLHWIFTGTKILVESDTYHNISNDAHTVGSHNCPNTNINFNNHMIICIVYIPTANI